MFQTRINSYQRQRLDLLVLLMTAMAVTAPLKFASGQAFDTVHDLIIEEGTSDAQVFNQPFESQGEVISLDQGIDPNVVYESEYVQSQVGTDSLIPHESNYINSTDIGSSLPNIPFLQLATEYSSEMLDFQNRQTSKERFLLEHARRNGGQPSATLGFQFRGSALIAETNTADKFAYLGRFPTDFEGTRASDIRLLQANQGFSFTFTPTVHGYFETLFSDVFSFGDFKQGSYQVRQAYVVFGDYERSPFYAYLGKKTVGFGDMGSLSQFTQAVPWHYFSALAEGGGIGYDNGRLHWTVAALNGSRGIRVSDSESKGDLNNFAANILWNVPMRNDNVYLQIGAGYLNGSIYDGNAAEHLDSGVTGERNGVWDVNAYTQIQRLHLAAEYLQTESLWPVTNHRVSGYRAEAAYDSSLFNMPARWSLSWSEGRQGNSGTEFEFNQQAVIGFAVQPNPFARYSLEYVRSMGFAPLMNITTASDRDVIQDSIVLGMNLTL